MKKYYTDKGYDVGKRGTVFEILAEDLSPNSNAQVLVLCDFCDKEHEMMYCKYLSTKEDGNCCYDCRQKKVQKTNMKNYGVKNTSELDSVTEKRKKTCLERYGYISNAMTEESKEKSRNTNLERYGYEYGFQSPEIRNKIILSNLEKYGVENPMQNEEVKSKVRKSLYENSSCPTSKAQKYICLLYKGELNYPIDWYSLDIYLETLGIYIEYQGSGHNLNVKSGEITEIEFQQRQVARYNHIKSKGLKMIELVNETDKLPSDNILLEILDECILYFTETNRHYISINLDELYKNKTTHFSLAN